MKKKERGELPESLLAATSPEYLESITEAREDYKSGRVKYRLVYARRALRDIDGLDDS